MALKTEARRQKILEAALCEFEARGYAAARMEDIARAAGVAKGTLYNYFDDKRALLKGLAESVVSRLVARFEDPLPEGATLRARLEHVLGPIIDENANGPISRTIRVIWSEGLHDPTLTAPFFTEMLLPQLSPEGPLFEAMAKADLPDAFRRHPQMVLAPFMQAILWQSLLGGREATQHARLHGRLVLAGASRKEGGREGRRAMRIRGGPGVRGERTRRIRRPRWTPPDRPASPAPPCRKAARPLPKWAPDSSR